MSAPPGAPPTRPRPKTLFEASEPLFYALYGTLIVGAVIYLLHAFLVFGLALQTPPSDALLWLLSASSILVVQAAVVLATFTFCAIVVVGTVLWGIRP